MVKPPFLPSPRHDEPLVLGSWKADDEGLGKEKQSITSTPDLFRRSFGDPTDAGPPGYYTDYL
ncbi:unnamed protein product [Laminaria digitata]